MFPKIGVPPNHPILIGFSIINHPSWGTPIFGNTWMYVSKCSQVGIATFPPDPRRASAASLDPSGEAWQGALAALGGPFEGPPGEGRS